MGQPYFTLNIAEEEGFQGCHYFGLEAMTHITLHRGNYVGNDLIRHTVFRHVNCAAHFR